MKSLIIFSFFILSCSPQKRLQRIISKNPNLQTSVFKDTLITFSTKSVDTLLLMQLQGRTDTFIIKDTKTKIIRSLDTLKVLQEAFKDSVRVNVITQEIKTDKDYAFLENVLDKLLMWIAIIILLTILLKRNDRRD